MNLHSDLKFEFEPIIDENHIYYLKTLENHSDKTRMCLNNVDYWSEKPSVLFIGLFQKNGLSFSKCPKHNSEFLRVHQDGQELTPIQIGSKDGFILNEVQTSGKSHIDLFFLCSTSCFRKKDQEINLHFEHIGKYKSEQKAVFRLYISQKPARSRKLLNKKKSANQEDQTSNEKKRKLLSQPISSPNTVVQCDHSDINTLLKKLADQNDAIIEKLDNLDMRLASLEVAVAFNEN